MNTFYIWIGIIVSIVATFSAACVASAWLIDHALRALQVHRAVIRYIWHYKHFAVWYRDVHLKSVRKTRSYWRGNK